MNSLPDSETLQALQIPAVGITTPEVRPFAPKALPAPAAAPKATETQEKNPIQTESSPYDSPEPAPSGPNKVDRGEMPPALFQGVYSPFKTSLMLTFKEEQDTIEGAPRNILILDLDKAELRKLKQNNESLAIIERAAGSLLLYPNGTDGTFEFLPNSSYQNDFAARNWGPVGVSQGDGFSFATVGKATTHSYDKRVEDHLWFRYFTTDINNDYLDLLREYGYNGDDFEELWKLANSQIQFQELKDILALSSIVLTDRIPLAELPTFNYNLDKLKDLRRSGQRMSFEQFDAMKADPSIWELLAKAQNPDLAIPAADKYIAARKHERDLNFSIDLPGTISDTILYDGNTQLELIGNFDYRINKDTTQQSIIVFGSKKFVTRLRRKSDYGSLRLVHKNRKQPLFVTFPLGSELIHRSKKGVTVKMSTKLKREQ
ncbi:hypothetical protein FUA23_21285 [Neolewinella aurantiaca]|uniref:Uncharacterized protein n=1 Tax=Neolewinella aurantiaca TaxID=2602767 RepID=A0A5C7FEP0_9BACT|nr:hypothetical protein [Neolewinella aurantiaca]TXF84248.1 hypothetical protein FUA23_21285 [Neolewinella aurantiaca]